MRWTVHEAPAVGTTQMSVIHSMQDYDEWVGRHEFSVASESDNSCRTTVCDLLSSVAFAWVVVIIPCLLRMVPTISGRMEKHFHRETTGARTVRRQPTRVAAGAGRVYAIGIRF